MKKESITKQVPAEIDTEKSRGNRKVIYVFDKDGKVVEVRRA